MRTTLTLDPDVAALVGRLQESRSESLKGVVNQALRIGLCQMLNPPAERAWFLTREADLGRCRLPNLDDVAEVIAIAEGEGFV